MQILKLLIFPKTGLIFQENIDEEYENELATKLFYRMISHRY